jgi:hypothetical protein
MNIGQLEQVVVFMRDVLLLLFKLILKMYFIRYIKSLPRKWLLRYLLLSMSLWIHMKETILALLLNQHLIYVEEEVCGQDGFFIDIMLVSMFF